MTAAILILLLGALMAAVSQVLLKSAAMRAERPLLKQYLNRRVLLAYAILLASTATSVVAYRWIDYKYGPIIIMSSYVFVMLLSRVILKEPIPARRLAANALIVAGIVIFAWS